MGAQLIYAVIATGLSLLAGQLLKKDERTQVDDRPTVLATRGSFIPILKGKRRIGLIFAWAGNRVKFAIKQGKKKWYKKREKVDTFFEDGWHILCLGPADGIYEIEESGKPIFEGIINKTTHPSGSLVAVGEGAVFYIFWGEANQPISTLLSAELGVASRWPGICYIYWKQKKLGATPQWKQMTYVVETKPQSTFLTQSDGYPGAAAGIQASHEIIGVWRQLTTQSPSGVLRHYFMTAVVPEEERTAWGEVFTVTNNAGIGIDIESIGVGGFLGPSPRTLAEEATFSYPGVDGGGTWELLTKAGVPLSTPTSYWRQMDPTSFYDFYDYLSSPDATGTIDVLGVLEDVGWNPAHIIAELLFDEWPHGIGADQADWDMDSLEALGVLTSNSGESLRCSFFAQKGEDMRGALASILQDLGVFVTVNMETGLLTFVPIREPSGVLQTIPDSAILEEIEQEVQHGPRPVDRVVFTFPDASLAFRDATISVDDDGQAARLEFFQSRTVKLAITVNFRTAAKIVERRAMEELSGVYETRVELGREARRLVPGTPILISGLDDVQRVVSTEHDTESNVVTVTLWNDFYGVSASDFLADPGLILRPEATQQDLISAILEVPEVLLNEEQITITPLVIRANSSVTGHVIYLGDTGSSLVQAEIEDSIMTGGRVDTDANDLYFQEEGPTFQLLGFDEGTVEDLTSDVIAWKEGRQLAVFIAANGTQEIAFVRNVVDLGTGRFQLRGVLRARYDTQLLTLNEGNAVFIFQDDDANLIASDTPSEDATLFMQSQPVGQSVVTLEDVEVVSAPIYGKGIRPIPVREIVIDTGANADGAGNTNWTQFSYIALGTSADDLDFIWNYSTPTTVGSGAGDFGAGQPSGDVDPEGDFSVEILDSVDTVVRSTSSTTASYTYTRTDRLADFSASEPALFKIRVAQIRGASISTYLTVTITNAT